jgi:hypothetical protein
MFTAAFGFAPDALWFPPLVETLIAGAIVYLALENVVIGSRTSLRRSADDAASAWQAPGAPKLAVASEGGFSAVDVSAFSTIKRRWVIAFAFGLLHGFGFSFGLQQTLQFAGSHVPSAILAYNVGIEAAQLAAVAVMVVGVEVVFRRVVAERIGTIIVSAIVAHTAWHWMAERWEVLRKFRVQWPAFDALFWVGAMRWMMLVVVAVGLYWLVFGVIRGVEPPATSRSSSR